MLRVFPTLRLGRTARHALGGTLSLSAAITHEQILQTARFQPPRGKRGPKPPSSISPSPSSPALSPKAQRLARLDEWHQQQIRKGESSSLASDPSHTSDPSLDLDLSHLDAHAPHRIPSGESRQADKIHQNVGFDVDEMPRETQENRAASHSLQKSFQKSRDRARAAAMDSRQADAEDDFDLEAEMKKAFEVLKTEVGADLGTPTLIERVLPKKIGKRYNLVSVAASHENLSAVKEMMEKQSDMLRLKKIKPRDGIPPSTRQLRVAQMIREAFGEISSKRMVWELPGDKFIIQDVRMAADLKTATVLWSTEDETQAQVITTALQSKIGHIRSLVAQYVQLRYAPNLVFKRDESDKRINRLNTIFDRIKSESAA
eukprot:TRINITY_DN4470_c0_g1_i1.p1 TRINITY_DN4470_c0_g1~~TRINITY_DN4470_c0_g1_i1.p1  ORF type:complete len:373 (-),score=97.63 TRINITY_DN4470_c0_g1_i1:36-1154(-)